MGQGKGRVVMPGANGGLPGQRIDVGEALQALAQLAQWPQVSEWVTLTPARFGVDVELSGMREIWMVPMGSTRGYRFPLDPALCRVLIAKLQLDEPSSVPESDEAAAAQQPAPFTPLPSDDDDPPTPPTMGQ